MEDDEEKVRPLAATVHKKTDGNAFFVLMFLRSLHDEQLLQYNIGVMKWTWDIEAVNGKMATENVSTMMVNKLRRLDRKTQSVLQIASCLGAKFSSSTVKIVIESLSAQEVLSLSTNSSSPIEIESDDETVSSLDTSVNELAEEGIFERDQGNITFGHDKIQSAAFELIDENMRDAFRGRMGDILMQKLDPDALEASLFAIVSLRNCRLTSITATKERLELATLNLRAGRKVRMIM